LLLLNLQISTERSLFTNTIEQLLTGIVKIEHMADCITDPGGDCWQDPEVVDKLRNRRGGVYTNYVANVEGMEKSLRAIMGNLALDPDGKVGLCAFVNPTKVPAVIDHTLTLISYLSQIQNRPNMNTSA
jgi:hypothetical protein